MSDDITTRLRRDCMSLIADEAADTIDHLRAERDEARREICSTVVFPSSPQEYANRRGWECFGEHGK